MNFCPHTTAVAGSNPVSPTGKSWAGLISASMKLRKSDRLRYIDNHFVNIIFLPRIFTIMKDFTFFFHSSFLS